MSIHRTAKSLAFHAASAIVLLGLATHAQAQNAQFDPTYGFINVARGFGSQNFSLQAGGQLQASSVGNNCNGFIANAPDYTIDFQGAGRVPLDISVTSSTDTTLVVVGPDGSVYCNDDSDGLNPALSIGHPRAGNYAVWVGTYSDGDTYPDATLQVSARLGGARPPAGFNAQAAPTYGFIEVARGFGSQSFDLQAGGTISANAINSNCSGYIADAPDYTIDFQGQGRAPLELSAQSSSDTTLVVVGPDGSIYCNDDSNDLNPALTINSPRAGAYTVWVGTFSQSDSYPNATLRVTAGPGGVRPPAAFNAGAEPTYGYISVQRGFGTHSFELLAGGALRASSVNGNCSGWIADVPDYTIDFRGQGRVPLEISVQSRIDTTLVVVGPDGAIYCNDDGDGLDPALTISNPMAGDYALWVGTYSESSDYPDATLWVTAGPGGGRPGLVK
ncbi:MAG: hypothetical protein ACE37E_05885 [Hyphomicrobiales bacterium]